MSMTEVSEVRDAVASMRALVAGFDPDVTLPRDAMELVTLFGQLENMGAAAKSLAANRVAGTRLWRDKGYKSAAAWLAGTTGTGVGEAVGVLQTVEAMDGLDATTESYRSGKLTTRQAKAVATAAKAAPQSEEALLLAAACKPVTDLETKAREIRVTASPETIEQRHARVHAERSLRTWSDDDAGYGQWKLPKADHVLFMAKLDAQKEKIFRAARSEGRREPDQAYLVDALLALVDRTGDSSAPPDRCEGGTSEATRRKRSSRDVKVIVRVDDAALHRGHTVEGEMCEIAGIGSIPVSVVKEWVDGDAFKAAIVTDGVDIRSVVHLGRKPVALQHTALAWITAKVCSIDGCTSSARLEIDHVADWATTLRTVVDDLARPCGHHHDLKTHHGFRFGPLRPDGKRALIAPGGERPPEDPLVETARGPCEWLDPPPDLESGDEPPNLFDPG